VVMVISVAMQPSETISSSFPREHHDRSSQDGSFKKQNLKDKT
jgi:hypothetical protein